MRFWKRITACAVLLASLWIATPGRPADLETLLRDFRATPAGLKPAPAFSLKGLDGKTTTLTDLRGRAALLYFWATW